jgi:hypothetical protein
MDAVITEVRLMMEQGISLERAVDIAYSRLIRKGIYNIGKQRIRLSMGTNYYLKKDVCPICGTPKEVMHIGKSSSGWCFALHVYQFPEEGPMSLLGWELMWEHPHTVIENEYGDRVEPDEMRSIITERGGYNEPTKEWLEQNYAVPGPYKLARVKIDNVHCIGHGEGTWDLIIGEFS